MKDAKLILPFPKPPTLAEFFEMLFVKPHGLAAQVTEHVYYDFFLGSLDLKEEYRRYYCVEYANLGDYIVMCHGEYLEEADLNQEHIFRIKHLSQIVDPLYSDNYLESVLETLKKWKSDRED
ncbi:hypothetical protein [Mesorhizobium sp. M5C.F.Ca.ET.164.01.1.1]|uniref:hypothetical protein n=1 Tax=Mesorhizobium sp. M5C.F.Ca.ET.164.01.1.1 TaxID=2563957 RepID=UPI001093C17F|nr:hypothetical protein [Mesorhizobium sp. M5C.F.Ca.ET.164.01.1.1]TGT93882.1 hypothetical protein EN807_26915 [Mesorhizobium sp. M5C.F.Ca.ET.164.01.1.1]